MATYSAVGAAEKAADAPGDVTLFDKLDQNPEAMIEGASGAPRIQSAAFDTGAVDAAAIATDAVDSAEIAAGAVAQGELKTTTGTGSVTSGSATTYRQTLPGGQYGFYPQWRETNGSANEAFVILGSVQATSGAPDSDAANSILPSSRTAVISLYSGSGADLDWEQRYVQSSPPYDLGDGEVALFVWVTMERGTGKIIAHWAAADPPWANNGPTTIAPDGTLPDGRRFRWLSGRRAEARGLLRARRQLLLEVRDQGALRQQLQAQAQTQRGERRIILLGAAARHRQVVDQSVLAAIRDRDDRIRRGRGELAKIDRQLAALKRPITMADKMADMPVLPSPFLTPVDPAHEVVMLDPPDSHLLLDIHEAGEGSIGDWLRRGDLTVDNVTIDRALPTAQRAVKWRKR